MLIYFALQWTIQSSFKQKSERSNPIQSNLHLVKSDQIKLSVEILQTVLHAILIFILKNRIFYCNWS